MDDMFVHVLIINDATNGRSGMFGVFFSQLIPRLEARLGAVCAARLKKRAEKFF
jgi:hypothetical protein